MALREAYVHFDGTATNDPQVADAAVLDVTDRLTATIKFRVPSFGTTRGVMGKYESGGNQRSWYIRFPSTSAIQLTWSPDGTAGNLVTATSDAHGLAVDSIVYARLDFNNGTVVFTTSTDGVTFNALSTSTANDGTDIFSGTGAFKIGNGEGGNADFLGDIYEIWLENAGTEILHIVTDAANSAFKDSSVNTLSVTMQGDSWTFVPLWNPGNSPILATAEAFLFSGDGNGDYGPSSINPWADLSGNNHHAARGAGAQNPTFNVDHWVLLNGDRFEIPASSAFAIAAAQSFSVVVGGSIDDFGGPHLLFTTQRGGFDDADKGFNVFETGGSGSMKIEISDGVAGAGAATGNILTADVDYTWAFVRDVPNDDVRVFTDGVGGSAGTDSSTGEIFDGLSDIMIGEEPSVANYDGRVRFWVWFTDVLTDQENIDIVNELINFRVGAGIAQLSSNAGVGVNVGVGN